MFAIADFDRFESAAQEDARRDRLASSGEAISCNHRTTTGTVVCRAALTYASLRICSAAASAIYPRPWPTLTSISSGNRVDQTGGRAHRQDESHHRARRHAWRAARPCLPRSSVDCRMCSTAVCSIAACRVEEGGVVSAPSGEECCHKTSGRAALAGQSLLVTVCAANAAFISRRA